MSWHPRKISNKAGKWRGKSVEKIIKIYNVSDSEGWYEEKESHSEGESDEDSFYGYLGNTCKQDDIWTSPLGQKGGKC